MSRLYSKAGDEFPENLSRPMKSSETSIGDDGDLLAELELALHWQQSFAAVSSSARRRPVCGRRATLLEA